MASEFAQTLAFFRSQLFVRPAVPKRSFAGETVIVTGSNVGLGKEAARHIARLNPAKLILAVRNTSAGEAAKKDIEATTKVGAGVIEVWALDLSSFASVKAFAERANSSLQRIDALLENAGVGVLDQWKMFEGHEQSITINVISTFLLFVLLLPKLRETSRRFNVSPRVTIVASGAQGTAKFAERNEPDIFAAFNDREKTDISDRYAVSKQLEVLLVRHLAPRLTGSGVVLNSVAPGFCRSELARDAGWGFAGIMIKIMKIFIARTTEVGSRCLVAGISVGPEAHGKYMDDGVVKEHHLGKLVNSEEGNRVGAEVWRQLSKLLDQIQPGASANVDSK